MKKFKHRSGKVKTKHQIIREAMRYIERIEKLDFVKLIVPDVINNNSHGENRMRLSTKTANGFSLTFGGAGAQKFHVVCEPSDENMKTIEETIEECRK